MQKINKGRTVAELEELAERSTANVLKRRERIKRAEYWLRRAESNDRRIQRRLADARQARARRLSAREQVVS